MDEDNLNTNSTDEREFTRTERNAYNFTVLQQELEAAKPNDRSPVDYHYQVLLTDLEKLKAYHECFILNG